MKGHRRDYQRDDDDDDVDEKEIEYRLRVPVSKTDGPTVANKKNTEL